MLKQFCDSGKYNWASQDIGYFYEGLVMCGLLNMLEMKGIFVFIYADN